MHVARADCERLRPGPVAQPANTVSSLALCLGGFHVWRTGESPGLGAAAVAAGLGSAAYHGPGGRVGAAAHDLTLAALAASTAAVAARPRARPGPRLAAALCLVVGAAVHHLSRTGRPLCRPDSLLQGHALWHVLASLAVVLAADAGAGPAEPRARAAGARARA